MGPGQDNVRRHWADRDRVVPHSGDGLVRGPVVRHEPGLRGHRTQDESVDLLLAKALNHLEPGAPRLAAVDFDGAGDQHLADPAAACRHDDRVVLGTERNDRLIRLDEAAQRLALRIDHGPAQLGAQHPAGSVRAEAELALELQRRNAIGVRRHQERSPEPGGQRQLAGMHDRAGRHRGLTAAAGTLIGEGLGLQQPGSALAATGADKPFRPTALEEVFRTRALRRKTTLELDQRPWKPALRSGHSDHLLTLDRSAAYTRVPVLYTTFRWAGRIS